MDITVRKTAEEGMRRPAGLQHLAYDTVINGDYVDA
jgi:hypothetical protein